MSNEELAQDTKDVQVYVDQHGLSGIDIVLKRKLESWKKVEIDIGITGDAGTGKSSFINTIRKLPDDDAFSAAVDTTECTEEPACYPYPTNRNIRLWDLPGIGTKTFDAYCEKVVFERYDTFLIFIASKFTGNELRLAKKIKAMKKSFFLIRAKIDNDVRAEKLRRKEFNEKELLEKMSRYSLGKLENANFEGVDVFLISNHHPEKWDFPRLTRAILDVLPVRQRECLTLSLRVLTRNILKRKVEELRGRIWMVASASAVGAAIPLPGLSIALDAALLAKEIAFYRSQLGLPDENSPKFKKMEPEIQEKIRKFCVTSAAELAKLITANARSNVAQEDSRVSPLVRAVLGAAFAAGIQFSLTNHFLHRCLDECEKSAFLFLDDLTKTE